MYEKANSVTSYDVNCPTWLHKYIIGKKGAAIQKLTVDLPKVIIKLKCLKHYKHSLQNDVFMRVIW